MGAVQQLLLLREYEKKKLLNVQLQSFDIVYPGEIDLPSSLKKDYFFFTTPAIPAVPVTFILLDCVASTGGQ